MARKIRNFAKGGEQKRSASHNAARARIAENGVALISRNDFDHAAIFSSDNFFFFRHTVAVRLLENTLFRGQMAGMSIISSTETSFRNIDVQRKCNFVSSNRFQYNPIQFQFRAQY